MTVFPTVGDIAIEQEHFAWLHPVSCVPSSRLPLRDTSNSSWVGRVNGRGCHGSSTLSSSRRVHTVRNNTAIWNVYLHHCVLAVN